jgi:hypothetical protein
MNTNLLSRDSFNRLRKIIKQRDGAMCQYCGVYASDGDTDHVLPLTKGGTDSIDNLVWACKTCNREKSDKTLRDWVAQSIKAVNVSGNVNTLMGKIADDIHMGKMAPIDPDRLTNEEKNAIAKHEAAGGEDFQFIDMGNDRYLMNINLWDTVKELMPEAKDDLDRRVQKIADQYRLTFEQAVFAIYMFSVNYFGEQLETGKMTNDQFQTMINDEDRKFQSERRKLPGRKRKENI